jgi:hypothetical protein
MPFIALVYVDDHTAESIRSGDSPWEGSARTVGLFRYPEKKDIGHAPTCKSKAWSRDPGGWMCCAGCRKRNPKIRQFVINALFDFLGGNSYPGAPAAFRTPVGYVESFADND